MLVRYERLFIYNKVTIRWLWQAPLVFQPFPFRWANRTSTGVSLFRYTGHGNSFSTGYLWDIEIIAHQITPFTVMAVQSTGSLYIKRI